MDDVELLAEFTCCHQGAVLAQAFHDGHVAYINEYIYIYVCVYTYVLYIVTCTTNMEIRTRNCIDMHVHR